MIWTIYCHTHDESGRVYVGLTRLTMLRRWNTHVYTAMRSTGKMVTSHFANAIRKYGKGAFSHQVIETCETLEVANATEEKWIAYFDTRNPLKGFNVAPGGSHTPHPIKNPWDRPEYRKKASKNLIAVTQTPQARANNKAALNTPESRAKRVTAAKIALSRPEVRAKIEAHNPRRVFTSETRAKLSAANLKRLEDPDFVRRLSENAKGRPKSPETIEKLRLTSAGRVKSPEELAKMSAVNVGRKHSPEHLARIAAKRKLRDATRIASRTHFECRKHGSIPLVECYQKKVHDHTRYECRECRKTLRMKV